MNQKHNPKNGPSWWACETSGKRGYRSKGDALAIASRASRHFGRQRAYRCPHCGRFHLTTRSKNWGP